MDHRFSWARELPHLGPKLRDLIVATDKVAKEHIRLETLLREHEAQLEAIILAGWSAKEIERAQRDYYKSARNRRGDY